MRKTSLERLLVRRPDGIFVNPFEGGEIGPDLFQAACRMRLEGLVSKRRDRPYQAGGLRWCYCVHSRQRRCCAIRGDHKIRRAAGASLEMFPAFCVAMGLFLIPTGVAMSEI